MNDMLTPAVWAIRAVQIMQRVAEVWECEKKGAPAGICESVMVGAAR